jgi:hypothetical protein
VLTDEKGAVLSLSDRQVGLIVNVDLSGDGNFASLSCLEDVYRGNDVRSGSKTAVAAVRPARPEYLK